MLTSDVEGFERNGERIRGREGLDGLTELAVVAGAVMAGHGRRAGLAWGEAPLASDWSIVRTSLT
jgi:hypothetical protein